MSFRQTETAPRWTGGTDFQRCVRAMEIAAAAGATIVNVVHREAGLRHRFVADPPLAQQIDALIRNLTSLIPIAEELAWCSPPNRTWTIASPTSWR